MRASNNSISWPIDFMIHDILKTPMDEVFDACFALDVIEHISSQQEGRFLENIRQSLTDIGVLIIGTPSLESQTFASRQSREGHVNCKSGEDLKASSREIFCKCFHL